MNDKEKATIYDFIKMCIFVQQKQHTYSPYVSKLCECVKGNGKIDKLNEEILKWCKENPPKTYKEDFLEKFPNAQVGDYNTPVICRADVYGDCKCKYPTKIDKICYGCWDTPMED